MTTDPDKLRAVMALRVIAATAQKLAHDLEHGRLWDGELSRGLSEIQAQMRDAGAPAGRGC